MRFKRLVGFRGSCTPKPQKSLRYSTSPRLHLMHQTTMRLLTVDSPVQPVFTRPIICVLILCPLPLPD
ncbi:hypothetical protein CBOM_07753 [Ceraceosorus bombacis]|uniref:Uncharacterized protein n=1 Tax=Ceraceosorus bombacis TaxID=401625 RepID=A0A0P1BLN3_9BASI|nr:hypothetical protein CBOM_07753 [Ceraceosorus bombacis]